MVPTVVKDSETTPVRVVYDGKAKYQGRSLNDCLIKGENINASLLEVALRFRENEVRMIADISKMFRQSKFLRRMHASTGLYLERVLTTQCRSTSSRQ